jgi:hypothetical protein
MKYLRSFNENNLNDIFDDVDSIFDSLRDYGYDVYVDKENLSNFNIPILEEVISFHIGRDNRDPSLASTTGTPFLIEGKSEEVIELKDCILRIKDFLSDWTCYMEVRYNKERYVSVNKNIKIKDDKFIETTSGDVVDFPIIRLKVLFIRKIKKY